LKSEGASFDRETCVRACWGGKLEVLKWLRSEEVNCPWNIHECFDNTSNKHKEMLNWLIDEMDDIESEMSLQSEEWSEYYSLNNSP
jgi:hypothetical protein